MHGLAEIIAMNKNDDNEVVRHSPSRDEMRGYIFDGIESFLADPPDSAYQTGYLAALLAVAKEGFREDMTAYPYGDAEALINHLSRAEREAVVGPHSAWTREEGK